MEKQRLHGQRLGKATPRVDPRTFQLAWYLAGDHPDFIAPVAYDPIRAVREWPMYGNDRFGDCVFAGAGHEHQQWHGLAHTPDPAITEEDVLLAYQSVTGFDPRTGANDNGTVVLDALNWRRHTGLRGGHKIEAYAAIESGNRDHVRAAIHLFGVVGLGVALPLIAQDQADYWHLRRNRHHPGTPEEEPYSWGGHYVPAIGYNRYHVTTVSWGRLQYVSWGFFEVYCDEAYAILSREGLGRLGVSPQGFDMARLERDLAAL